MDMQYAKYLNKIRYLFEKFVWDDRDPDFNPNSGVLSLCWIISTPFWNVVVKASLIPNVIILGFIFIIATMAICLTMKAIQEKYRFKTKTMMWLYVSLQVIYDAVLIVLYYFECLTSITSCYIMLFVSILFSISSVRLFIQKRDKDREKQDE
jgi:hypothetical protein